MEENKPILYRCKNWSYENNCCKGYYDIITNAKYQQVKINPLDIPKDCKGYSNIALCCWFVYDQTTIVDMQRRIKRYG